jgi:predicted lipoprotein with Yx(FWY)xxD motif
MIRTRLALAALPAGLAALVALAGCGSGSSASSATASPSTSGTTGGGMATIAMTKNPQLGPILTDSMGNTVYVFAKDSKGMSNCNGACASVWPPVTTTGKPTAGSGVLASKLGTTKRSDGSTQVTYGGRPLYTYTADSSPGDVTGNGVNTYGGLWYAVQPNGSNAPAGSSSNGTSSTGSSTTSGSSSGGYGY